ncbi:restriction endonuclease subunit S [Parahaliea maris]|uniref:restriction endonuclease subunit S n=1 Tax=Parahaliea maris TaxID=2716870 RepID=UPI00164EDEC1|nr:restriction endonuclease subunit S [Parahaliea maris]
MKWQAVEIGAVCNLMTGGTPKTSEPEYYEGGDIPWIVSGDIHKGEIFDCEKRITTKAVENSNARYLPKDSVLIALNGQGKTRGTVALLRIENATCNQSVVSINPNSKDELDPEFLFYYLKSQYRQIRNLTGDKDRAGLNMPLLRSISIPLPPLSDQKRIAAILDKADNLRRKRQQAIQLADEFLRAVFLEMFGDPVTNPKKWERKAFSDLGSWSSGGTPSRRVPEYFDGDINWYSAGELNSRYLSGSVEKITQDAIENTSARVFNAGSILLGMYDTAAFKASILREDSSSNQACANLKPNASVNVEWFYSFIMVAKHHYLSQRRGVRQKNLNLGMIREFELPLPPIELQMEYASIVGRVMHIKSAMEGAEAIPLFRSLSQKAFSGEL